MKYILYIFFTVLNKVFIYIHNLFDSILYFVGVSDYTINPFATKTGLIASNSSGSYNGYVCRISPKVEYTPGKIRLILEPEINTADNRKTGSGFKVSDFAIAGESGILLSSYFVF